MTAHFEACAETYEVYALRYATHEGRRSHENFLGDDPHGDARVAFDFYFWVIRNAHRTVVVDTGFSPERAAQRKRTLLHSPVELLEKLGIDAREVRDVVLTHMHYDHAGNLAAFPQATFHLQEAEMAYCTGRCMCHEALRRPFEAGDVAEAIRHLFAGRVRFAQGDAAIAPGISVHLLGGHTSGLQAVRVRTARGHVLLASDAAHYWDNVMQKRPFPIVVDVAAMLEAFARMRELARTPAHIIPGHDPAVRHRFPHWGNCEDIVQLHLEPESKTEKWSVQ
jgi:glyoxylase-like metal-dependent hydrolase (beta-lactamase superfamily II)